MAMSNNEKQELVSYVTGLFRKDLDKLKEMNSRLELKNIELVGKLTYYEKTTPFYIERIKELEDIINEILKTTDGAELEPGLIRQIQKLASKKDNKF